MLRARFFCESCYMPEYYWILLLLIFFFLIYWKRQKSYKEPKISGPDGQLYHRKEEHIDYYSGRKIYLLTRLDTTGQNRSQVIYAFFLDSGEKCTFSVYKIPSGGYIQFKDGKLSMVKVPPDLKDKNSSN